MKVTLSDKQNNNSRNFRNNSSNQRNRQSKPGYKRNPAPDRSSRRPRSGGLVKAKILDYRPGKEFGKLVPLEGEFRLTQLVFYKNSFDERVEHHIYKNQEVLVLIQKENDNPEVKKIEVSIDYRTIPGDEKYTEGRDETKKETRHSFKETGSNQLQDKKEGYQKTKPKNFNKPPAAATSSTLSSSGSLPVSQEKDKVSSKPSTPKKDKKPRVDKQKEQPINPLAEMETSTEAIKEETKVKTEFGKGKKSKDKSKSKDKKNEKPFQELTDVEVVKEQPISEIEEVREEPISEIEEVREEPISEIEEVKEEPISEIEEVKEEPISEIEEENEEPTSLESEIIDEEIISEIKGFSSEDILEESNKKLDSGEPAIFTDISEDVDELNSLVDQISASEEESSEESAKENENENDIASLIPPIDELEIKETEQDSFDENADIDDNLVSAPSSTEDLADVEKQFQDMMSTSDDRKSEDETESKIDSKYQKGFSSDSSSILKSKKSSKPKVEEDIDNEPRKTLKEELAEESEEESLLEKLVSKIAVEIDDDDDDEDEYENEEENENNDDTDKKLSSSTLQIKNKNVLSEIDHETVKENEHDEKDKDDEEESD